MYCGEDWNDLLFITASNDSIAGDLRLERKLLDFIPKDEQDIVPTGTSDNGNGSKSYSTSSRKRISYYNIEGGNHSGFGHYGPQSFPRKDGPCVASIEIQQKECMMRTLDFILDREPVLSTKKKD